MGCGRGAGGRAGRSAAGGDPSPQPPPARGGGGLAARFSPSPCGRGSGGGGAHTPRDLTARPSRTRARSPPRRATTLEELRAAIAAFDGCALRDTASNLIFAEGDPSAALLLIGDPPGADDDRSGTAFAGPAGDYLDRMLAAISLERGQLLMTPLIPWRPPGDRPPSQAEIAVCLPFLHRLIALVAPRRLLLMGLLAARALLPQAASRRRPRGAWMDAAIPGTSLVLPALPTFSAAELMRDPTNRRAAWDDLQPAAPHAGCRRRNFLNCAHQEGRAMPLDESRPFIAVNIAVLTVSDTRTLADDRSGDALAERIAKAGHRVAARAIEKDDAGAIERHLRAWIADREIDVVITTGGTGITGRDVTPEAFEHVLEKRIEGFGELFRMLSYQKIGTSTMQSRALGGVAGGTYLFALPGSTGAVKDAWDDILVFQLDNRFRPCNLVELMPRLQEHLRPAAE